MKDNASIDELLSGYVDGELSPQQHTEIRRLTERNAQVKARVQGLQNLKKLISGLPRPDAPAEIADHVRSLLERRTLFGEMPDSSSQSVYSLLFQKIRAGAAAAGLIAIFLVLIYSIMAPPRSDSPGAEGIEVSRPQGVPLAQSEESVGLSGRLELDCSALSRVDSALQRSIEQIGVIHSERQVFPDRRIYQVKCSEAVLRAIIQDIQGIWPQFTDARLYLYTSGFEQCVEVKSPSSSQLMAIASQGSVPESLELAKRMAVRNSMQQMTFSQRALASLVTTPDDIPTVPKPMLTAGGSEPRPDQTSAGSQARVSMTIVLMGANVW